MTRRNKKRRRRNNREQIKTRPRKNKRPPRRRRKRELERTYRRRRIGLVIMGVFLILIPGFFIIKKIRAYPHLGYPSFRDEVLLDMSTNTFVSSTEGRSLTSAEKTSDFDKLYETIVRNFAVDEKNRKSYYEFVEKKEDYKKKISSSKTDQDFFMLINDYLSIIKDPYTKVLEKNTYQDLFDHYKNKDNLNIKKLLENPQVVNRYKRIISQKDSSKPLVNLSSASTITIKLIDFKLADLEETIEEFTDLVTKNPQVTNIILDLEDNRSINYLYVNEFAKYFLMGDYRLEDVFFYRGGLVENDLEDIKKSDISNYQTGYIKNIASKYPDKADHFKLEDYNYYDQISVLIKKDMTFANRNIYILANENTACEPIRLSSILKDQGAYIIKNGLNPDISQNDKIKFFKPSLFSLDHSGLVISINSTRPLTEDSYLEYDQNINSNDPISTVLSITG